MQTNSIKQKNNDFVSRIYLLISKLIYTNDFIKTFFNFRTKRKESQEEKYEYKKRFSLSIVVFLLLDQQNRLLFNINHLL